MKQPLDYRFLRSGGFSRAPFLNCLPSASDERFNTPIQDPFTPLNIVEFIIFN